MSSRAVPTDVDSLMASALLAISRASESREGISGKGKTDVDCRKTSADRDAPEVPVATIFSGSNVISGGLSSLYFGDAVPKLPPRLSPNACFDPSLGSKSLLSGYSAFPDSPNTKSIDNQVNTLALQAAMISDKAIAATLLKGAFGASGIPLGGNALLPLRANSSPTEPKSIRRQEIVKALHSKPQRGRKRANLNDFERQELTRTRNREHAKSTRVRKKMRYEELLNCEKILQENLFKENLDSCRRGSVVDFLSIREQMLQNQLLPSSFGECNYTLKLGTMVEDIAALIFDDGSQQREDIDVLNQMNQFDAALSTIIFRKYACKHDVTFAKSVLYRVRGSAQNEVALTSFGSALAEVDIVIQLSGNDQEIVRSYLLRVEFASESDKIRSVLMREMKIESDARPEILENQTSHPSVVSLEAEKDQRRELESHFDKQTESDDGMGSGMTF